MTTFIRAKDHLYSLVEEPLPTDKHIKAYPAGGGFQVTIPKEDVTDWNAAMSQNFKFVNVELDDIYSNVKAWVNEEDCWNGWVMPYFPKEEADKVAAQTNKGDPDYGRLRYNPKTDTYKFTSPNSDDEEFPGEVIRCPDGVLRRVYGIGAASWIWSLPEESE